MSHMGVSKNIGTPKWIVYFMENPMNKWMIWGETPLFLETPMSHRTTTHHFFDHCSTGKPVYFSAMGHERFIRAAGKLGDDSFLEMVMMTTRYTDDTYPP